MKEYWQQLQVREQRLIIVASALVVAMLFYSMVIDPLAQNYADAEMKVKQQRILLMDLQQAARSLGPRHNNTGRNTSDKSLLSRVDASARQFKLQEHMKNVEPDGKTKVRVWLEKVPFDSVMAWLQKLSQSEGVIIDTLESERLGNDGLVNIRLVLESSS